MSLVIVDIRTLTLGSVVIVTVYLNGLRGLKRGASSSDRGTSRR